MSQHCSPSDTHSIFITECYWTRSPGTFDQTNQQTNNEILRLKLDVSFGTARAPHRSAGPTFSRRYCSAFPRRSGRPGSSPARRCTGGLFPTRRTARTPARRQRTSPLRTMPGATSRTRCDSWGSSPLPRTCRTTTCASWPTDSSHCSTSAACSTHAAGWRPFCAPRHASRSARRSSRPSPSAIRTSRRSTGSSPPPGRRTSSPVCAATSSTTAATTGRCSPPQAARPPPSNRRRDAHRPRLTGRPAALGPHRRRTHRRSGRPPAAPGRRLRTSPPRARSKDLPPAATDLHGAAAAHLRQAPDDTAPPGTGLPSRDAEPSA